MKEADRSTNRSSNSSVDTTDRTATDDDFGEKSTRSNSPQLETVDSVDAIINPPPEFAENPEESCSTPELSFLDRSEQVSSDYFAAVAENSKSITDCNLESSIQFPQEQPLLEEGTSESGTSTLIDKSPEIDEEFYNRDKVDQNEKIEIAPNGVVECEGKEVVDENEGADGFTQTKKQKKKRTPSILKALGLDALPEPEMVIGIGFSEDQPEEDGGRRYGSSRTAAALAKTKLSTKSSKSNLVEGQEYDGVVNQATGTSRGKKEKSKQVIEPLEWVCCDRCSKWRRIPLSANIKDGDLPDKWFCEMSTWSHHFNSCDAEDEGMLMDDSNRDSHAKQEDIGQDRGSSKGTKGRGRSRRDYDGDIPDSSKRDGDYSRRRSGKNNARNLQHENTEDAQLMKSESDINPNMVQTSTNWVQCNKCTKWRKVPLSVDVDSLPDIWFCENNSWNFSVARCSAKQEEDDTGGDLPIASVAATTTQKEKKPKTSNRVAGNSSFSIGQNSHPISGQNVVNNINWVRCEKRDCKKWRKVPGNIDVSKFPEKWYCYMNSWNQDLATCDAPEESDNEIGIDSIPTSQLLVPPNQKALSYRKILFGNDGRMRLCFTDKNKSGTGIFTYMLSQPPLYSGVNDEELDPRRRVSYWWSSAYDESAAHTSGNSSATIRSKIHVDSYNNIDSTYMLDSIRRIYDIPSKVPSNLFAKEFHFLGHPSKRGKSFRLLSQLSVLQRLQAECTVVRSCFLALSVSSMLFSRLQEMLKSSRFLNPHVNACREFMTEDVLKCTVRRMEEVNEVEVYHSKDSQLIVCLLMSTDNLRDFVASKSPKLSKGSNKFQYDDKWAKEGCPLKLRKFFLNKNHILNQQFNLNNIGEKGSRRQKVPKQGIAVVSCAKKKQDQEKMADTTNDQDLDISIMLEQDQEQERRELQEQEELEPYAHEDELDPEMTGVSHKVDDFDEDGEIDVGNVDVHVPYVDEVDIRVIE